MSHRDCDAPAELDFRECEAPAELDRPKNKARPEPRTPKRNCDTALFIKKPAAERFPFRRELLLPTYGCLLAAVRTIAAAPVRATPSRAARNAARRTIPATRSAAAPLA